MFEGNIIGNLTDDAVVRTIESGENKGDKYLTYTVATSNPRKRDAATMYLDCIHFGGSVENLAGYLTKGKQVRILGDVEMKTFKKGDGSTGAGISVDVLRLKLLGGGQDRADNGRGN